MSGLQLDPAKVALGKMLKLVEDGILVRNIEHDNDFQTYLVQSNRLVVVLNEAQRVLSTKDEDDPLRTLALESAAERAAKT